MTPITEGKITIFYPSYMSPKREGIRRLVAQRQRSVCGEKECRWFIWWGKRGTVGYVQHGRNKEHLLIISADNIKRRGQGVEYVEEWVKKIHEYEEEIERIALDDPYIQALRNERERRIAGSNEDEGMLH